MLQTTPNDPAALARQNHDARRVRRLVPGVIYPARPMRRFRPEGDPLRFGWNVLAPIQLPRATTQQAQPEQQLPEQR